MYKMIAIDVDDTLINDQLLVSEPTKAALAKAADAGVIITLATGRMYASAKQIARQVKLNVPLITYQGSLVKNLLDETILYERSVPKEMAQFLYDYSEKHGLHLQAYYNDELYVKEENQKVIDYSKLSNIPYVVESDLHKLIQKPMTKMLFIDEPEYLDTIAADLHQHIGGQVHMTKSKPHFLEILHKEGTKGHAVQFLANHFGLDCSQVIAIGDSWNDREMLEVAGLGVAMENAVESLKEIADYITLSNNEEGVKHVIEKFIFNEQ
jgi:Cof subfamily protein (haloacid dehalogenase superfamily)